MMIDHSYNSYLAGHDLFKSNHITTIMTNQTKWKVLVDRWNSKDIQSMLIDPFKFVTNEKFKPIPYAGQFFGLILAFASTIYNHAYPYDNLTREFYADYANKISNKQDMSKEQQKLFKQILEKIPKGFKNCRMINGYLSVPTGTDSSIKQANEFLDFLTSDTFNDIMKEIRRHERDH